MVDVFNGSQLKLKARMRGSSVVGGLCVGGGGGVELYSWRRRTGIDGGGVVLVAGGPICEVSCAGGGGQRKPGTEKTAGGVCQRLLVRAIRI